jgi:hypothetical protein
MQLTVRRRLADRIWQWRNITYIASTALVLLAIFAVFFSISSPSSFVQVSTEPTFFEPSRAFRATEQFAARFPDTAAGGDGDKEAASWFAGRLQALAIPGYEQEFTAPLGDHTASLNNVVVVFPGESREAILVAAQRDPLLVGSSAPATTTPPLAKASGTGILLDLIQVFAARPHEKTLIFVSSDGGGYGGLGVDYFLRNDPRGRDVRVVLSMYGLGRENRDYLRAGIEGPSTTAPGWYFQLAAATLGKAGLGVQSPGLGTQVADHALVLCSGEQTAGLRLGVPALMLFDTGPGRTTAAGLATQGSSMERLVLSLDAGTEIPSDPGTAVVLSSGRYLTSRELGILGALMLLPGALMAFTWLAVTRMRPDAWLRYLRNLASFVLPLLGLLLVSWVASRAGLLPHYRLPAPPQDPPARDPEYLIAAALFVVGLVLFFVSRHFLGYLRPREPLVMAETVKLSVGLLVLVAGLALLASSSPFSILTGITAAWAWPLVTCFAEPTRNSGTRGRRPITNRLLLMAGLTAPALLYLYLVVSTDLRWWEGWWFLLVQTVSGAYGILSPIASALITAGFLVLLGVKRLLLIPIETLGEHDDLSLVEPPPARVRKVKRRG